MLQVPCFLSACLKLWLLTVSRLSGLTSIIPFSKAWQSGGMKWGMWKTPLFTFSRSCRRLSWSKGKAPWQGTGWKKKDPIWFTYHFAISCFCMDVLERPEADFILAQISHYEWQTHRSDAFDQIILAVMTSTFTAMNGKQLLATWHQFLIDNRTGTDDYDPKWLNC